MSYVSRRYFLSNRNFLLNFVCLLIFCAKYYYYYHYYYYLYHYYYHYYYYYYYYYNKKRIDLEVMLGFWKKNYLASQVLVY